jgi:site-specific recombinase XerD
VDVERHDKVSSKVSFLSQHIVSKCSIATHLPDAGANLALVKDWLGHANIQNTTISAQLMTAVLESMARKVFARYQVVESAIVTMSFRTNL